MAGCEKDEVSAFFFDASNAFDIDIDIEREELFECAIEDDCCEHGMDCGDCAARCTDECCTLCAEVSAFIFDASNAFDIAERNANERASCAREMASQAGGLISAGACADELVDAAEHVDSDSNLLRGPRVTSGDSCVELVPCDCDCDCGFDWEYD